MKFKFNYTKANTTLYVNKVGQKILNFKSVKCVIWRNVELYQIVLSCRRPIF